MKKFNQFLNEEVTMPMLVVGTVDINRQSVRDEINAYLSNATSASAVTPYSVIMRIRKVLAYFHIDLPKTPFMEGGKGVEVFEINQFGHKMGMNNDGTFISGVPANYYLYFSYNLLGAAFHCVAKIVDKTSLDKLLDSAETIMKEGSLDEVTKEVEDSHTAQTRAKFKKIADRSQECGLHKGDPDNDMIKASQRRAPKEGIKKLKHIEGQLDETRRRVGHTVNPVASRLRKFSQQPETTIKHSLGVGKKTKTILVTRKGDPRSATGGGVIRIPRDKYDPRKYNLASE